MALFDSIKKATGLGLSPQEALDRAYEKGVLLGPTQFARAIELFDEAAARAAQAQDSATAARARASSALYSFVTTGQEHFLEPLKAALATLPDIEQVGSRTERWPAPALSQELSARLAEARLRNNPPADAASAAREHAIVAAAFKAIFGAQLITYRFHSPDDHREDASARYFLHHGLASQSQALVAMASDPEAAAESMSTAMASFRQCGDAARADKAERWLTAARQRRTCWLCHREFQGAQSHFHSVSATVTPYVAKVVEELGQDTSTIDPGAGTVVLCNTCASGVKGVAEAMVAERTKELREQLAANYQTVRELQERVARLERK